MMNDVKMVAWMAILNNISLVDLLKARDEARDQGDWQPAAGGTEVPFETRSGRRLLYCWQPSTGRHAYLDLGTDIVLTDAEAEQVLSK